jgi:hypothetical protein
VVLMKKNNVSKKWVGFISAGFLFATVSTSIMTQQSQSHSISLFSNDASSMQTRYNEQNPLKIQCFLDATNDLQIEPSSFYASLDFLSNEITSKNPTYTMIKGQKVLDRFFSLIDAIQSNTNIVNKTQVINKLFHFQGLQRVFELSRKEFQLRLMDTESCRQAFKIQSQQEVNKQNATIKSSVKSTKVANAPFKGIHKRVHKNVISVRKSSLDPVIKNEQSVQKFNRPTPMAHSTQSYATQELEKQETSSYESIVTKKEDLPRKQLQSYTTQDALMSH